MSVYERLFAQLAEANVRYVVVGGVAVVLQGYPRLTADLDLVVDLEPENVRRAISVLETSGLQPFVPVRAADFADPAIRRDWVENKNMKVFSMRDPRNPVLTVDLFVREPIPFEDLWARATRVEVGGHAVPIASIADLILMKRAVGRPQDMIDVENLETIQRERAR